MGGRKKNGVVRVIVVSGNVWVGRREKKKNGRENGGRPCVGVGSGVCGKGWQAENKQKKMWKRNQLVV